MPKASSSQRLATLFTGGVLLLNYPLLSLWDRDAQVFGLPLFPVALFALWALLIGLVAWLLEAGDAPRPPDG